jgi:[ribosomal protein S5]-alanine N-acetyltransferase
MRKVPTINGNLIILRCIKESDIDDRLFFGRPNDFVYMCGGNRNENNEHPSRDEWERWYQYNLQNTDDKITWMIEYNNRCIGNAGLHHISMNDNSATFAIGIWDTSCFSKGMGTEATRLILRHAFDSLKLHRVDLKVLDYNKRGIRCYEKCGLRKEGILRESAFIEGQYHSDIIMSILESEYSSFKAH